VDLVFKDNTLNTQAVSSMIGVLAQKSNICAKVIDRNGEVVAVNRRGLELLELSAEEICGKVWTALWESEAAGTAKQAVQAAFDGERSHFTGHMQVGDRPATWDVEARPLQHGDSGIETILVLSTEVSEDRPDTADSETITKTLRAAMHAFGNVANSAASGARLVRRGVPEDLAGQLADELEAASERASTALEELRDLVEPGRNDTSD
jgi:PAS domain S-box-containing protein